MAYILYYISIGDNYSLIRSLYGIISFLLFVTHIFFVIYTKQKE